MKSNSIQIAIRRAAIAIHIQVLDMKYRALGNYLTDAEANKKAAETARKELLMRRVEARTELLKLGGR